MRVALWFYLAIVAGCAVGSVLILPEVKEYDRELKRSQQNSSGRPPVRAECPDEIDCFVI